MKTYMFRDLMYAIAFLIVAFGIFFLSLAWLDHQYREKNILEIPRIKEEIQRLDEGINNLHEDNKKLRADIMPSAFKGVKREKEKNVKK